MNVTLVCCILASVSPGLDVYALPEYNIDNEISSQKNEATQLKQVLTSAHLLPEQDTGTEISSLRNEVTQLKQTLASLQTQSHTQDQKYAAIVSNVLSSISALKDKNNTTDVELVTIKNQLSSVVSTVASIENHHNSTVLELNNVKNQLNTSVADLNVLKSQLAATGNTSFNESKLSSLRSELGNLGVCFEAFLTADHVTIKDKGNMIFDNVTENLGQSYDPNSGAFTAPTSGTYLFWGNILRKGTSKRFYADIYSSIGRLTRGYAMVTGSMNYNAATPIVVTFLTKGEQVWFVVDTGASSVTIVGSQSSSYGGTLLHMHNI